MPINLTAEAKKAEDRVFPDLLHRSVRRDAGEVGPGFGHRRDG